MIRLMTVGGFQRGEDYVFLRLHFEATEGKVFGTYGSPLPFHQDNLLEQVNVTASTVTFELAGKPHGLEPPH